MSTSLVLILIAFGSGVVSAGMGGLIAFIMCGVICIPASFVAAAGVDVGFLGHGIGIMSFGPFVGPYVAYASGVVAAGYAGKVGHLENGADIVTPMFGFGDVRVLLVGGLFGVLAQLFMMLYTKLGIAALTDGGAMVVVTLTVIGRLVFGKTGLTGKYTEKEPRRFFPNTKELQIEVVLGGAIGLLASGLALALIEGGVDMAAVSYLPFILFGFSAIKLYGFSSGGAVPVTHHLTYPSASAAIAGITLFGPMGMFLGVAYGIGCAIFDNIIKKTFNSYNDTHIDPEATTIMVSFFLLSAIKMIAMA
ncbi:hypothetical protein [Chakrabartyella piscis]|uniref:hypothetical protein n=1 Tax=Chakrabartyella piscis TaxID=2918914 RepID=UPI002958CBC7|nr:hypothetical protein [Chakrabartyella piscis]